MRIRGTRVEDCTYLPVGWTTQGPLYETAPSLAFRSLLKLSTAKRCSQLVGDEAYWLLVEAVEAAVEAVEARALATQQNKRTKDGMFGRSAVDLGWNDGRKMVAVGNAPRLTEQVLVGKRLAEARILENAT